MSSDSISALKLLLQNDYASLVVASAVVYDYILTFPKEVEYVWGRPWTAISTVFVLIRYIGLCWIMTSALVCTSFIPGPLEVSSVVFLISFWTFAVFLSAADLVMILRVFAMWNRSKRILYILLFFYLLQIGTTVIYIAEFNNPHTFSVRVARILGFSSCDASFIHVRPMRNMITLAPRFALGAVLVILAVLRITSQSFSMYKVTKQWQLNRYMIQLVKDGILYFLVNMLYQIACALNQGGTPPPNTFSLILNVCAYVLFYPLVPRFIISVRALYDHALHDHDHEGIDSGFGVLSRPEDGSSSGLGAITVSSMVHVNGGIVRQSPAVGGCDVDDVDVSSLEGIVDDLSQV